jgi:hypothetical protein
LRLRNWLIPVVLGCAGAVAPWGEADAGSAEVKLDREYLAGLIEKLPPLPFKSEKSHGTTHDYRLIAIEPPTRRFVVACLVEGEFDPGPGPWRKFLFEVRVGINVESAPNGTPRFRIDVEEVRRRELEGLTGTLARLLGKYFDDIVTRVAAGKANQLSGKLNAEIVKRVAAFKEYGVFTGIDYAPSLVTLHFEMTRFKADGVAGYVYPATSTTEAADPTAAPPGTVPLYRAVHPRLGTHLYTLDRAEAERRGFRVEGVACQVFDRQFPETVPLYLWRIPRDGFYTTAPHGEGRARLGYRPGGIACFLYPVQKPGTIPFYRFVDPRTGHHFYTVHPHAEFAASGPPASWPAVAEPIDVILPRQTEAVEHAGRLLGKEGLERLAAEKRVPRAHVHPAARDRRA